MASRVEIGQIWNRIVDTKRRGQPGDPADVSQLTELLAKNPDALEEILMAHRNGNRQEPK